MQNDVMEAPKNQKRRGKPAGDKPKRVRRGRMLVEIRKPIAEAVAAYAESRAKDATEAVNDLVLIALESKGLWPVQ